LELILPIIAEAILSKSVAVMKFVGELITDSMEYEILIEESEGCFDFVMIFKEREWNTKDDPALSLEPGDPARTHSHWGTNKVVLSEGGRFQIRSMQRDLSVESNIETTRI
jgi:hypothetical protein